MTRIRPRAIAVSRIEIDSSRRMFRQPISTGCTVQVTRQLLRISGEISDILRAWVARQYEANQTY